MPYTSEKNLLNEFPELQIVNNPYTRFYLYRLYPLNVISDVDRSPIMKENYKFLNWYDEIVDSNNLEPDTFFASAHNMIHDVFIAFDNNFYIQNFKNYCTSRNINYDKMTDSEAIKYNRYEWMIEPLTINHYIEIISDQEFLRYIDLTHTLGNFLIVPKNFGWKKASKFHESFVQSLRYLEDNFSNYNNIYDTNNFEQWKMKFFLEDFYENNELFEKISNAEESLRKEKNYKLYLMTLPLISDLIEKRTKKIITIISE